jgi:hypothetical protein
MFVVGKRNLENEGREKGRLEASGTRYLRIVVGNQRTYPNKRHNDIRDELKFCDIT